MATDWVCYLATGPLAPTWRMYTSTGPGRRMPEMHSLSGLLWVIPRCLLALTMLVQSTSSGPIQVLLANSPTSLTADRSHPSSSFSSPDWPPSNGYTKQRIIHSITSPHSTSTGAGNPSKGVNHIGTSLKEARLHHLSDHNELSGQLEIEAPGIKSSIKEHRLGLKYQKGFDAAKAEANDVVPKVDLASGKAYSYNEAAGLDWDKRLQVEVVAKKIGGGRLETSTARSGIATGKSRGYRLHRARIHMTNKAKNPLLRPKPLLDHFHGLHFGIMDPAEFPQRPPVKPSYSVEGTFLWAVGLFGTVENGAVLLTAIFSKKFKKPLHLLIGSLAITDLFVSLIYIPSYTYYLLEGDRMLQRKEEGQGGGRESLAEEVSGLTYCKLSRSIFVEIASVTLTIKALIAFYFYISACSRELVSQIFSTKNTLLFVILAWGMNFVMLFIPKILGYQEVDFYPNSFICSSGERVEVHHSFSRGTASAVYTFVTLSVHIAELMVIGACFVKVHMAIVRGKTYSDKHRSADKQAKVNYMRALKITCLVFVSFCICWMPIYIINILDPSHKNLPTDVHHLVMDLLLLKSSINPTIYIYGIRSLRYEIKLLCLCRCRSDNSKEILARQKCRSSSDGGVSGTFSTLSGGV